ncbi:MAG: DUF4160 domain-containing protein [Chloroflexi bacterium]|nr:DUF4160 domain-containing protein [Chloroflexota bacterium]
MFVEINVKHHLPHFHVRFQEHQASFSISPVELLSGELPRKQRRLVEAWAEIHQEELELNWERAQKGQQPLPILPL